jgi:single-strand DNA-binding protein
MSVNKVILIGNAGKDAEVRYIDSGIAVASFSLATSESYVAKSGEKVSSTEWHNIIAWRGLAEFAGKYIQKGKKLYVEGRIKSRTYDDKDGIKRYVTEIYADSIQLLDKRETTENGQHGTDSAHTGYQPAATTNAMADDKNFTGENNDDLPF